MWKAISSNIAYVFNSLYFSSIESGMLTFKRVLFAVLIASTSLSCNSVSSTQNGSLSGTRPQNVIFFISDGCGPASFGLAREYQKATTGETDLFIDSYLKGVVQTFSGNHKITDSAASSTAYSCAIKTYNGAIGLDMNQNPVETVLEAAEKAGYQTALVSTARITHATPAAFSSHVVSRNMEAEIASQQIGKGIEILMGGGQSFYLPKEQGGLRLDGRNVMNEAAAAGYTVATTKSELDASTSLPLLALFTSSHMAYEIDRDENAEPSLAEMTDKSLSLLSGAGKPFFIMIEAGRIDHAGHSNDAAAHIQDVLAYDDAMKVAVAFAEKDKNTLVMGTSDHETGGLTLGAQWGTLSGYDYNPQKLTAVHTSIEKFMTEVMQVRQQPDPELATWIETQSKDQFGLASDAYQTAIKKLVQYRAVTGDSAAFSHLRKILVDSTARVARVGWSTGNHTSVDVPVFAFGPGSELFSATMDNTEVGEAIFTALGLKK
jgi:alkaline phosphatase